MKKQYSTAADPEVFEQFKATCGEYGIAMNTVIEGLMKDFVRNEYSITITKSGVELKRL